MKKLTSIFSTIICLTMMLFVIPTIVKAEEISKEINADDLLEVTMRDENQSKLFDYTVKDGVITIKVKDENVYNALIAEKNIAIDSRIDKILSQFLVEDCADDECTYKLPDAVIGLNVMLAFPEGADRIELTFISNDLGENWGDDESYREYSASKNDEESDFIKNGKYYFDYAEGVLFTYWPGSDGYDWLTKSYNVGLDHPISNFDKGYYVVKYYNEANEEIYNTKVSFKLELEKATLYNDPNGVTVYGAKYLDSTLTVEKLDTKADVYKELNKRLEGKKLLGAFEVKLNGEYEGKLNVSFNVDSKYNGEKATVLHKKSNGTVETFEKVITDGKVTVEVDELSPFVIALSDVKEDSTPTLGVPSYVGLASLLVLCAGVCLIKVLKKD